MTERVRYLIQIAIPLPGGLSHALRRPTMDLLRTEVALQHRFQNHLHQHIRLHRLPYAQRLQTDARPESRHIQGAISAGGERSVGDTVPVQVHIL